MQSAIKNIFYEKYNSSKEGTVRSHLCQLQELEDMLVQKDKGYFGLLHTLYGDACER